MNRGWKAIAGILLLVASCRAGVLAEDLHRLFTPGNLAGALAGAGLAGAVHPWDDEVQGSLEGRFPFEFSSDFTNLVGSSRIGLPASLGLWEAGKVLKRKGLEEVGSGLLRTLAYAHLVVAPIKLAAHRERPDGSNHLSFPSGHAANSFAVARFMHRYYGGRVGLPFYAFGVLVAAGRIEDDLHYLSDVVMGASLGLVVGNSVTLGKKRGSVEVTPSLGAGGLLIVLHFR